MYVLLPPDIKGLTSENVKYFTSKLILNMIACTNQVRYDYDGAFCDNSYLLICIRQNL